MTLEKLKNARRVCFADGSSCTLTVYTARGLWMMAALELRLGAVRASKGDSAAALNHFEEANFYFYPSLDHRRAPLLDDDERLECEMRALHEHEQAFGPDSPQVAYLRDRMAAFQEKRPRASASWEDAQMISDSHRTHYLRRQPPRLRDGWQPVWEVLR